MVLVLAMNREEKRVVRALGGYFLYDFSAAGAWVFIEIKIREMKVKVVREGNYTV